MQTFTSSQIQGLKNKLESVGCYLYDSDDIRQEAALLGLEHPEKAQKWGWIESVMLTRAKQNKSIKWANSIEEAAESESGAIDLVANEVKEITELSRVQAEVRGVDDLGSRAEIAQRLGVTDRRIRQKMQGLRESLQVQKDMFFGGDGASSVAY